MTLREAVSACLSNYATFAGRARRSEFWMAGLAFFLALMAWGILIAITGWDLIRFLAVIFMLACILPLLAVQVRRLHDVGRSGWWLFIRAVPLVGDVVIFVFSCTDSQPFTNSYGPPPKPIPYLHLPEAGPLPPAAPSVGESDRPFYKTRRKAALEASGRHPYKSGEPTLDSHKGEDYFAYSSGQKPPPSRELKPAFSLSTMSRKTTGIAAGSLAFAVLILGIFLGANSWKPSMQDSVQTAPPAPQPVAAPTLPPETPTQQTTASPPQTVRAPVPAPPPATQAATPQPGDLGLASPLRPVDCAGKFAVFYHSSITPSSYAQDIQANLASHPGSKYLLTLGSCSSLYQMSNAGTMIYAVYGGPFDTLAQACVAASRFPDEAYVKVLDNTTAPDQSIRPCS